jgi:PIN domain nuclease of toxin-antitoxin system
MRLLLDTHILLWALDEPVRLDQQTRDLLEDPTNEVLFSAASIWEIAIKVRLGRADFPIRPELIAESARATGFTELPVRAAVAARVADLPLHHRDPFDRLLVAQAIAEPARFYTSDAKLAAYSELVTVIG